MSYTIPLHKVFISYHHAYDQVYKDEIVRLFNGSVFYDWSVNTREIDEGLPSETIRVKIRDDYLRGSTVTILLVGRETKQRKFVDWELYSSMRDGVINRKSGILVINLPTISQSSRAGTTEEKNIISPNANWIATTDYSSSYPYMPERVIDSFKANVPIAVVDYDVILNKPKEFKLLIDYAHNRKATNNYDLSRPMRVRNG
jgi:hypothetical protein